MRRVVVLGKKTGDGAIGRGFFHQFGTDIEEYENGGHSFTTAIVEMENGKVMNLPVERILFEDKINQ